MMGILFGLPLSSTVTLQEERSTLLNATLTTSPLLVVSHTCSMTTHTL